MSDTGSAPQVSVVIPVLGNHTVLRRVLEGYARQDAPPSSFEVLVVGDRDEPDPAAVEAAAAGFPFAVRHLSAEIPGPSAKRNVGWRAASADLVLFTDSDTIPSRRLVAEHRAWHERFDAEEATVIGPVRWARGLKVTPFMRWLERGVIFDFDAIEGVQASWAHMYTANLSVKRSFLDRVGGYEEERLPYGYEDIDWGRRAYGHGVSVMFNERAVVDHWRPMTVDGWRARAPRLAVSEWRFCELHPDVRPWFHDMLSAAAAHPPGGRRSAALAGFVPRWVPWLGPIIWERAGLYWRQQIAPPFLAAWDAIAAGARPEFDPTAQALSERRTP